MPGQNAALLYEARGAWLDVRPKGSFAILVQLGNAASSFHSAAASKDLSPSIAFVMKPQSSVFPELTRNPKEPGAIPWLMVVQPCSARYFR